MKILVTGAAGFIGGYLYKALKSEGHEVIGVDNFYNGSYAHKDIFSEIICNDIRTLKLPEHRFNIIYHLAAQISVDDSNTRIKETFDVNVNGTLNLIENIEHDKFIFASTSETYGSNINPGKPMPTDHPMIPQSPYGVSKMAIDHLLRVQNSISHANNVIIRQFNVCGYGQSRKAFISKAIHDAYKYNTIFIYGDGTQLRDFTNVNDCVDHYLEALNYSKGVYSYGKGFVISINDIALMIQNVFQNEFNKSITISHIHERPGEVMELNHGTLSVQEYQHEYNQMKNEIRDIVKYVINNC